MNWASVPYRIITATVTGKSQDEHAGWGFRASKFVHYFSMSRMKRGAGTVLVFCMAWFLGGCVYFNAFFNGEKAYHQALKMREQRLDKNPEDSILATSEEKLKLERAIAKGSKVLEIYPNKTKYQPKALFLIGESYLFMGEYAKAIEKYDELQRYFPNAEEIPIARFHRARSLFLNGQYAPARTALEDVAASTQDPKVRYQALELLARLELESNSPQAALAMYEKLLQEHAGAGESVRANAHYEAAKLAFGLKMWARAREHAKSPVTSALPTQLRYRCEIMAAECLFNLGRGSEGERELEAMLTNRIYTPFLSEIHLRLADGYMASGKSESALKLLHEVPLMAPKSMHSAEAFFKIGEHFLKNLKDEKKARGFFDSAANAGAQFEYAILAKERSAALGRLAELRNSTKSDSSKSHFTDFMIAELFLFRLDNMDSALTRLDNIIEDTLEDSVFSVRAAYARAFIHDEFKKTKEAGDSLYRYVLDRYPNTEYAKQAEKNMGLKPTIKTDEDNAHALFLEAEKIRFGGGPMVDSVVPAYRKVVENFPFTNEAAKAQFVIAMIYEEKYAKGETPALDSAKQAYMEVRKHYSKTPYFQVADRKLTSAGAVTGGSNPEVKKDGKGNSTSGSTTAPTGDSPDQKGPEIYKEVLEGDAYEEVMVPPNSSSSGTNKKTESLPESKTEQRQPDSGTDKIKADPGPPIDSVIEYNDEDVY